MLQMISFKTLNTGISRRTAIMILTLIGCLTFALLAILSYPSHARSAQELPASALPMRALKIDSANDHACAISNFGKLWCWGYNGYGQLGDLTTENRYTPVQVLQLPGLVSDVATGSAHTCAIVEGTVWCVGANFYGQLGNATSANNSITPTQVVSLPNPALSLCANFSTTCALTSDKSVWCWGLVFTSYGGHIANTPERIGYQNVVSVSLYTYRICLVYAGGNLSCQGISDGYENSKTWLVTDTVQAASGVGHICVLTTSNAVKCWGKNNYGQVGNGITQTSQSTPILVDGLEGEIKSIQAGDYSTCALMSNGSLQCWGLGVLNGPPDEGWEINHAYVTQPVTVSVFGSDIASFSIGLPVCAIGKGGSVKCAGNFGSLGDGSIGESTTPTNVVSLNSGVLSLDIGWDSRISSLYFASHACALDGYAVKCWGQNMFGQIGDGTTTSHATPVTIIASGAKDVYAGGQQTCAVLQTGEAQCWGRDLINTSVFYTLPITVSGLNGNVAKLAVGNFHVCALYTSGAVNCWGNGGWGQLGIGMEGLGATSTVPITPTGLESEVIDISSGYYHSCAILSDHTVRCWGDGANGTLGTGSYARSTVPTITLGVTNAIKIDSSVFHTCALLQTGGVKCWGANGSGEIGDGTVGGARVIPVDVLGLQAEVVQVSAGQGTTCVVMANNRAKCWGSNAISLDEVTEGFITVQAGFTSSCGITTLGAAKCWGQKQLGQLGNGEFGFSRQPASVIGFGNRYDLFLPVTMRLLPQGW